MTTRPPAASPAARARWSLLLALHLQNTFAKGSRPPPPPSAPLSPRVPPDSSLAVLGGGFARTLRNGGVEHSGSGACSPRRGSFPQESSRVCLQLFTQCSRCLGASAVPRPSSRSCGVRWVHPQWHQPKATWGSRSKGEGPSPAPGSGQTLTRDAWVLGQKASRLKRPGPGGRRLLCLCSQLWLGTFPGGRAEKRASWAIPILGKKCGEKPFSGENSILLRVRAQSCPNLGDPRDWSPAGSSVLGFSGQEYGCGQLCFLPGDLPTSPGIKPVSPVSCIVCWILHHVEACQGWGRSKKEAVGACGQQPAPGWFAPCPEGAERAGQAGAEAAGPTPAPMWVGRATRAPSPAGSSHLGKHHPAPGGGG